MCSNRQHQTIAVRLVLLRMNSSSVARAQKEWNDSMSFVWLLKQTGNHVCILMLVSFKMQERKKKNNVLPSKQIFWACNYVRLVFLIKWKRGQIAKQLNIKLQFLLFCPYHHILQLYLFFWRYALPVFHLLHFLEK